MRIILNGRESALEARTVEAALAELGHDPAAAVATALNGEFVPREERAAATLTEGDRLEVVTPRQGG